MNNANPREKALALGAQAIEEGINWTWAVGFPTKQAAEDFVRFLESIGYEHRGVYGKPHGAAYRYPEDTFAVRFR